MKSASNQIIFGLPLKATLSQGSGAHKSDTNIGKDCCGLAKHFLNNCAVITYSN